MGRRSFPTLKPASRPSITMTMDDSPLMKSEPCMLGFIELIVMKITHFIVLFYDMVDFPSSFTPSTNSKVSILNKIYLSTKPIERIQAVIMGEGFWNRKREMVLRYLRYLNKLVGLLGECGRWSMQGERKRQRRRAERMLGWMRRKKRRRTPLKSQKPPEKAMLRLVTTISRTRWGWGTTSSPGRFDRIF